MSTTARRTRRLSTVTVLALAVLFAVTSYVHMRDLAYSYGLDELTARLWPFAADGMVFTASLVMLDEAERAHRRGFLPWVALLGGAALSLWANAAAGGPSVGGKVISGAAAAALFLSLELLTRQVRRHAADDEADVPPVEVVLGRARLVLVEVDRVLGSAHPAPAPVHTGAHKVNGVHGPVHTAAANSAHRRAAATGHVHTGPGDAAARVHAAVASARKSGGKVSARAIAAAAGCSPTYASRVMREANLTGAPAA